MCCPSRSLRVFFVWSSLAIKCRLLAGWLQIFLFLLSFVAKWICTVSVIDRISWVDIYFLLFCICWDFSRLVHWESLVTTKSCLGSWVLGAYNMKIIGPYFGWLHPPSHVVQECTCCICQLKICSNNLLSSLRNEAQDFRGYVWHIHLCFCTHYLHDPFWLGW